MNPIDLSMAKPIAIAVFGAALLAGCANSQTATEQDFGNSVRQMVRAQTLNPGPADPAPVESSDPNRLENALETYRKDVARPESIRRDPTVDVFGQDAQ